MGFTQLTVIMYIGVLAVFVAVATALPLEDTPEVLEAKAKFTAAFAAAEKGEHAALAPVNSDVQAAAPVYTGEQIATSYIADTMEVAEAKAKHLATVQAPAPEFTGVQIPTAYLADTMEVADAKATFKAAFVYAAAHPYTYHTGLTYSPPVVPYTTLPHN